MRCRSVSQPARSARDLSSTEESSRLLQVRSAPRDTRAAPFPVEPRFLGEILSSFGPTCCTGTRGALPARLERASPEGVRHKGADPEELRHDPREKPSLWSSDRFLRRLDANRQCEQLELLGLALSVYLGRANGRGQPRCGAQRSNAGCRPLLGGVDISGVIGGSFVSDRPQYWRVMAMD